MDHLLERILLLFDLILQRLERSIEPSFVCKLAMGGSRVVFGVSDLTRILVQVLVSLSMARHHAIRYGILGHALLWAALTSLRYHQPQASLIGGRVGNRPTSRRRTATTTRAD